MVHTSFKSRGHTESKILHNKVEVIFWLDHFKDL